MRIGVFPEVLLLGALTWTSCHSRPAGKGYETNPGTDSSVMIEREMDSAAMAPPVVPDTVLLIMNEEGRLIWAGDSLEVPLSRLSTAVQDSLLSIYLHTHRLPSRLELKDVGTVTMGVRGVAGDQLREAQEVLRQVVSARQTDTSFGRLSVRGRQALRDSFPVLFQSYY